jgi:hypothetical protein
MKRYAPSRFTTSLAALLSISASDGSLPAHVVVLAKIQHNPSTRNLENILYARRFWVGKIGVGGCTCDLPWKEVSLYSRENVVWGFGMLYACNPLGSSQRKSWHLQQVVRRQDTQTRSTGSQSPMRSLASVVPAGEWGFLLAFYTMMLAAFHWEEFKQAYVWVSIVQ